MSLADVLAAARSNPPTVLAALARIRQAEAQLGSARAPWLPTVTASSTASVGLSNGTQPFGTMVIGSSSMSASIDAALNLRWTIWDFGRTASNVRAAELGLRASREDARAVMTQAINASAAAFFVLLTDEQTVASMADTLAQRERLLQIAQGLVDAGARPPIERVRAEVARDAARMDLGLAEAALRNDAAALAGALGWNPAILLRAGAAPDVAVDDTPARAADLAVAARPELVAANARVAQAEAQLRGARAGYLPSLSMTGSASIFASGTALGPDFGNLASRAPLQRENLSAGVTLTVPIFDPIVGANVRVSEANLAAARATVDQQLLTVRTDAVQAAIAVRSARDNVQRAERLAAGAAANLEQAQGRYQAGAAPMLELVDAQTQDTSARLAVIQARMRLAQSQVRLLGATGRLARIGAAP